MSTASIIIRTDANIQIGSGHVMRCLALAQMAQHHGQAVTFICHQTLPDALHKRLLDENMSVQLHEFPMGSQEDADNTLAICNKLSPRALILDGYHFSSEYQLTIQTALIPLLVIDDNGHLDSYHADWILNQNIHADKSLYPNVNDDTQLLLGTEYALLRKEFWQWRGTQRDIPEQARHLLIIMGGTDANNVTLSVLEALRDIPEISEMQVRVIVGGGNPHSDSLEAFVRYNNISVELLYNVTDMPALMAWADLAISAGGSTVWEFCMMGVPIIAIITADNQVGIVNELTQRNLITSFSILTPDNKPIFSSVVHSLSINHEARTTLSKQLIRLVDGYGSDRVTDAYLNHPRSF